jgi:major inositol transporter-like SP family MFS transporter
MLFPTLLEKVGLSGTFFIFAALGFVSIAFIRKFMPETKGRSLEEIEAYFRNFDSQGAEKTEVKMVK